MDEPKDYHSKWSKSETQKPHDITYMWNLKKNGMNELIYETEIDLQTLKTNLWLPRRKGEQER